MIYAERGNRVKEIAEQDVQKYIEQGYTITNGVGQVIQNAIPTDMASLRLAYVQNANKIKELTSVINQLKAENAQLNESIKQMNSKPKKAEVVEEPVAEESVIEEAPVESPKRARKSKIVE